MRLDIYLCEKLGIQSRSKAANLIKMGKVKVDGRVAVKAGVDIDNKAVELLADMEFASMGGYKLERAIQEFDYNVVGKVCADIGASNGGFTDCLLSHGAKKVFAVDVGECALPTQLRLDDRVVVIDRFNARELTNSTFSELVDLVVVDVSFISLKLVLPPIINVLKVGADVIALLKPQFEVGKQHLSKKGIVIDEKARSRAMSEVLACAHALGLNVNRTTNAPLREGKNVEYLIYLTYGVNVL